MKQREAGEMGARFLKDSETLHNYCHFGVLFQVQNMLIPAKISLQGSGVAEGEKRGYILSVIP